MLSCTANAHASVRFCNGLSLVLGILHAIFASAFSPCISSVFLIGRLAACTCWRGWLFSVVSSPDTIWREESHWETGLPRDKTGHPAYHSPPFTSIGSRGRMLWRLEYSVAQPAGRTCVSLALAENGFPRPMQLSHGRCLESIANVRRKTLLSCEGCFLGHWLFASA